MTVVSNREFAANQEKYFDMAENENVCIKRGSGMFRLIYQSVETQYPEQVVLEPDNNLRNAITAEELLKRVHKDIHNKFTL
jgi:hypothetical protein